MTNTESLSFLDGDNRKRRTGWHTPLSTLPKIGEALKKYGLAYVNVGPYEGAESDEHRELVRQLLEREIEGTKVILFGASHIPHHDSDCIVIYTTLLSGTKNRDFGILLSDSY